MSRQDLIIEIYLRLTMTHPGMEDAWRIDEAIRRADAVLAKVGGSKSKKRTA